MRDTTMTRLYHRYLAGWAHDTLQLPAPKALLSWPATEPLEPKIDWHATYTASLLDD